MNAFEQLKILCDQRGISINHLEEQVGLGRNTLYSWKKKMPTGTNLTKVADYLGVSTDYLLGRSMMPYSKEQQLDIQEQDILTFFRLNTKDLSVVEKDELRDELKDYMEFMSTKLRKKAEQARKRDDK